jgi:hypothetical protein
MRKASRIGAMTAAVAAIAALSSPYDAPAQQLASLEGSWSGNGRVLFPSGASESARCRAIFRKAGGNSFSMSATCATQSARVQQTANLERVSANRFVGDFHNAEYNVTGSITISVRGSGLSASMSGGGASAQFSLQR